MLAFDVRPSAKLSWGYFLTQLRNWCCELLFDFTIKSDCDRWYCSVRATNSSVLNTESVNEVEDNDVWRKLQESASKSVIWLIELSLQWLSDEEKVLSASSADLMLEFVHWESLSWIFTVEKRSDLTMFSRMWVRDVQSHIIVVWEMQWSLSYNVCKELCAVCWEIIESW